MRPKQRILITGATGMVGRALTRRLTERGPVLPLSREQLDVSDAAAVEDAVAKYRPHVIAHLGAWTDVDGCELDPAKAQRVNALGTEHVARSAARHNARMLYVSTDYVFDGTATAPIAEDTSTSPINAYGQSKLGGELAVRKLLTDYYIVRTSWVFGEGGKNFVDTVARLVEEKDAIDMVDDQVGCPTYAPDLAGALERILDDRDYGTYHVTNDAECSWYMLAQDIAKILGSDTLLRPVSSDQFPRPARRPRYSVLGNYRLHHILGYRMRPWREAVREYLESRVIA